MCKGEKSAMLHTELRAMAIRAHSVQHRRKKIWKSCCCMGSFYLTLGHNFGCRLRRFHPPKPSKFSVLRLERVREGFPGQLHRMVRRRKNL
jgi:hypothetical protein